MAGAARQPAQQLLHRVVLHVAGTGTLPRFPSPAPRIVVVGQVALQRDLAGRRSISDAPLVAQAERDPIAQQELGTRPALVSERICFSASRSRISSTASRLLAGCSASRVLPPLSHVALEVGAERRVVRRRHVQRLERQLGRPAQLEAAPPSARARQRSQDQSRAPERTRKPAAAVAPSAHARRFHMLRASCSRCFRTLQITTLTSRPAPPPPSSRLCPAMYFCAQRAVERQLLDLRAWPALLGTRMFPRVLPLICSTSSISSCSRARGVGFRPRRSEHVRRRSRARARGESDSAG